LNISAPLAGPLGQSSTIRKSDAFPLTLRLRFGRLNLLEGSNLPAVSRPPKLAFGGPWSF
jgi:hypothetical protein